MFACSGQSWKSREGPSPGASERSSAMGPLELRSLVPMTRGGWMCVVLTPQFGVLGSGSLRRLTHIGKFPLFPWAPGSHNPQLALSTIDQSSAFHTSLLVHLCSLSGPAEKPRRMGSPSSHPVWNHHSLAQSCLTLSDPTGCSTPGLPVHHQLLELAQTHVHRVTDAIQPPHPLSAPSPAFNLSQHQGLFQ